EFIEGGDLGALIQEWHLQSVPSPRQVAGVVLQLAEIVGYAHSLNPPIVHRDLKPANILVQVRAKGALQLKVADFGIGGVVAQRHALDETPVGPRDESRPGEVADVLPGGSE